MLGKSDIPIHFLKNIYSENLITGNCLCRVVPKTCKVLRAFSAPSPAPLKACESTSLPGMTYYCYMIVEGQKVSVGVHPDAVLAEDYSLPDCTAVHVIVGEE